MADFQFIKYEKRDRIAYLSSTRSATASPT